MWKTVAVRLHTPRKIFPFGTGADEIMLYGIVDYTFKDKREASVRFLTFKNGSTRADNGTVGMGRESEASERGG